MWRSWSWWVALAVALAVALCGGGARARLRCLKDDDGCHLDRALPTTGEYYFTVQGQQLYAKYEDSDSFMLRCEGNLTLDVKSLPKFESLRPVNQLTVDRCPAPSTSYAAAFEALNVTLPPRAGRLVVTELRGSPPLASYHFTGFTEITKLTLITAGEPLAGFLQDLRNVTDLKIQNTTLPEGELVRFPPSLRTLWLIKTKVAVVPADALMNLQQLHLTQKSPVHFEPGAGAALRLLQVEEAESALLTKWTPPRLQYIELIGWGAVKSVPFINCSNWIKLSLFKPTTKDLPAGWVAQCPQLQQITVRLAYNLISLPERLLEGADNLKNLSFISGKLNTLPRDLLLYSPLLENLNLGNNKLLQLPDGLFVMTKALISLNLSYNKLNGTVMHNLKSLVSLRKLNLSYNKQIANVCGGYDKGINLVEPGLSDLSSLTQLTSLNLQNTSISLICRDWRENMSQLKTLNLSGTKISQLMYYDLQYQRSVSPAEVILRDVPLIYIIYSNDHYKTACSNDTAPISATDIMKIDDTVRLRCDCHMYWTAEALKCKHHHVALRFDEKLKCMGGAPLVSLAPQELRCDKPTYCEQERECKCSWRPDLSPPYNVLRVDCENAGLLNLPRLPSLANITIDLLLANNLITELNATNLPSNVGELDLRNNSLLRISTEVAQVLVKGSMVGGKRRVHLAGNNRSCDCLAAPIQSMLQNHASNSLKIICENGRMATPESINACRSTMPTVVLASALAALGVVALVVTACLARSEFRHRLKEILHRLGWIRPPEERWYDVFLSFFREDSRIALELAKHLESDAPPYRVIMQERDWLPPAWVPERISESVVLSWRTVLVISPNFVSSWNESKELRDAYAEALDTGRLVPVLLLPKAELALDGKLGRYLTTHPYHTWGEPRFWKRLKKALPKPCLLNLPSQSVSP